MTSATGRSQLARIEGFISPGGLPAEQGAERRAQGLGTAEAGACRCEVSALLALTLCGSAPYSGSSSASAAVTATTAASTLASTTLTVSVVAEAAAEAAPAVSVRFAAAIRCDRAPIPTLAVSSFTLGGADAATGYSHLQSQ
eukprot:COSAG01_NODE_1226_length_11140_cov_73.834798_18_plen_142_part_00